MEQKVQYFPVVEQKCKVAPTSTSKLHLSKCTSLLSTTAMI